MKRIDYDTVIAEVRTSIQQQLDDLAEQFGTCSCGWYPKPFGIIPWDGKGTYYCPDCATQLRKGSSWTN